MSDWRQVSSGGTEWRYAPGFGWSRLEGAAWVTILPSGVPTEAREKMREARGSGVKTETARGKHATQETEHDRTHARALRLYWER